MEKELAKIKAKECLGRLSAEQKIGQMNQLWGFDMGTGGPSIEEQIRKGLVGSCLYVMDPAERNRLQHIAVEEAPGGVPIFFALDIVNGHKTLFPAPICQASSWDPSLFEKTQAVAAGEARADGYHWTFFPNADIGRDARWGRVQEGCGEDPYLSSAMVAAQVRGFQGQEIGEEGHILACAKHFAGYGAATGGRDYDEVYLSEAQLRNDYLPPFKAAIDAGVGTIMSAYMDLNNVPATANEFLMKEVLRREWDFDGMVVTDAGTIGNLITQGFAKDTEDAALRAAKCDVNMDMGSMSYMTALKGLLEKGQLSMEDLDRMVLPILTLKYQMGLFDNPYTKQAPADDEAEAAAKIELARTAAERSVVLLKNEDHTLPLSPSLNKIAVIGPCADNAAALISSLSPDSAGPVTVLKGIENRLPDAQISYVCGPKIKRDVPWVATEFMPWLAGKEDVEETPEMQDALIADAVKAADAADAVIMVLGELLEMSNEHSSRACIDLPGRQNDLLKAVMEKTAESKKPVVLVLLGGRPLSVGYAAEHVPAILEAWQTGQEAGNAIARILFGDVNPGGKLPTSFPRSAGQAPFYYAKNLSHAPEYLKKPGQWDSRYWDQPNTPLFPFGHGLSYSTFEYGQPKVSAYKISPGESVTVTVDITNTSDIDGDEVAQLYIHQRYGSDSRPRRLLKGFKRLSIPAGAKVTVSFELTADDLSYWSSAKHAYVQDETDFDVWTGGSSEAENHTEFSVRGTASYHLP